MSRTPLPRLQALTLLVTRQCNLACSYCFVDRAEPEAMPEEVARAAIDLLFAAPDGEPSILFSGGEPLLVLPRLRAMVAYARARRPPGRRLRLHLNTNGTLLTPEAQRFLAAEEIAVQLSFDGGPSAPWARGREIFATLDRRLAELRRDHPYFFRRNLQVALNLTPTTVPFLAEAVEYLLAAGVATIQVGAVLPRGAERSPVPEEALERQFARIHEICRRHRSATGEIPLSALRPFEPDEPPLMGPSTCRAGTGECLAVLPSGEAAICSLFASPGGLEGTEADPAVPFRLGRLGSAEFAERAATLPDAAATNVLFDITGLRAGSRRCRDCPAASTCFVCPAGLWRRAAEPDWREVPELACALQRATHQARRRFHEEIAPGPSEGVRRWLEAEPPGIAPG